MEKAGFWLWSFYVQEGQKCRSNIFVRSGQIEKDQLFQLGLQLLKFPDFRFVDLFYGG